MSFSWGELEAAGSNLGDAVIFRSQFQALSKMGAHVGVLTADVKRTERRYPGVRCFDVSRGRLRAMLAGLFWCEIAVAGGGELVQDVSSRLYSLFNLFPLLLARLLGKKTFAWAIGVGQRGELSGFTEMILATAAKGTAGITARDRGSFNTLHRLGIREPEMILAADCALAAEAVTVEKGNLLGAAPRNVSNRKGNLLPLEMRKKLGVHKEESPIPAARAWGTLLDRHIDSFGCDVVLFPFHTGSLSNDDKSFCSLVKKLMRHSDRVSLEDPSSPEAFTARLAECRVMVTIPLHGAILAAAAGTIPVCVSYSSKCVRFMEQAGMVEFVSSDGPGKPSGATTFLLDRAWTEFDFIQPELVKRMAALSKRADLTALHFRKTFGF